MWIAEFTEVRDILFLILDLKNYHAKSSSCVSVIKVKTE